MASIPITGGGSTGANSSIQLTSAVDFGLSGATTIVNDSMAVTGTSPYKFSQTVALVEVALTPTDGAVGLIVQFDSANTNIVTVYGKTGGSTDGIPLHPTATAFIPFDTASLFAGKLYMIATASTDLTLSWV